MIPEDPPVPGGHESRSPGEDLVREAPFRDTGDGGRQEKPDEEQVQFLVKRGPDFGINLPHSCFIRPRRSWWTPFPRHREAHGYQEE